MALRLGMLKNAGCYTCSSLPLRRLAHVAAAPPPLDSAISTPSPSQPLELPEYYQNPDSTTRDISGIGFGFPSVPFSGSIELMAVPKKKISKHKRGIRNGPKALKPVPVIVRCKSCGRVKLPHFFCCSGERRPE